MKNLWAPWRVAYVTGEIEKDQECLFDKSPDDKFSKKDLILVRTASIVVLLNKFPYVNGHLLVAPARHVDDIVDLTADENWVLMKALQNSVTILRQHMNPDGFNIGLNLGSVAGAGITDHLHYHVVPRWQGDHNFITVLADVRTIPEHLDTTFDKLLPDFQSLAC